MEGFIANLFEFFGFVNQGNFSNDMYNNGFYMPLFILMLVSCLTVTAVYYYLINHPRINRGWQWLLFNFGTAFLNFILAWIISSDKITAFYAAQQMYPPYDWTNYFILGIIDFFWTIVFFFVSSFIIKWWSRNCKHTPFL